MEAVDLGKILKEKFGGAVRAIADKDDFDFYAIPKLNPIQPDGTSSLDLYPNAGKSFVLNIKKIETKGDELWITTPKQIWVFRQLGDDKAAYIAAMEKDGLNVD